MGHDFRLMVYDEMMWCAYRDLAAGYEEKAGLTQQRAGAIDPQNPYVKGA